MRHFISNHGKVQGTSVTLHLLITITQHCFTVKKKIGSVISQLRLVGSHNTCLGSVAQGAWQLEDREVLKHTQGAWISFPVSNWKKALDKMKAHEASAWYKMAKAKVEAEKQSQAEGSIILQLKQGKERCDEQRSFSMAQDGKGQSRGRETKPS